MFTIDWTVGSTKYIKNFFCDNEWPIWADSEQKNLRIDQYIKHYQHLEQSDYNTTEIDEAVITRKLWDLTTEFIKVKGIMSSSLDLLRRIEHYLIVKMV